MLIPVLTFLAVVALVFGTYWVVVVQPEARRHRALRRRLKSESTATLARIRLLRQVDTLSAIGGLNFLLGQFTSLSVPLKGLIRASGLRLTVGRIILSCTTLFFAVLLATNYLVGIWWLGLLAAMLGAYLPLGVVKFFKARRMGKFEEQFPEAVELIARAMRAGHAFATGLKMAADELPAPVGPEFKALYDQQNYGAQMPDALRAFADRIPLVDARFFVTAVLTQREAGGNLSEVLDRLAGVMRERFKIRREVRVRSAHGRMTAYVLAAMPPGLAGIMMILNPDQLKVLTTDPLGIRMIMAAVVLQVLGTLVVRKIVDIQY